MLAPLFPVIMTCLLWAVSLAKAESQTLQDQVRDDYQLYDGLTGVNCTYYNKGAVFKWRNKGGDWRDANGTEQGLVPIDTAAVSLNTSEIRLNVTNIMKAEGFAILRQSKGTVHFYSRELSNSLGPKLVVKLKNSSELSLRAVADSTVGGPDKNTCNLRFDQGKALDTSGRIFIQFPPVPDDAVSATLVLRVEKVYYPSLVGVFAMSVPRIIQKVTTGLSENYPNDEGIENHPDVIYTEKFDDFGGEPFIPLRKSAIDSWVLRTAGALRTFANWKNSFAQDGFKFPTHWVGMTWVPEGYLGHGLKAFFKSETIHSGTALPNFSVTGKLGEEAEELYVRYYMKFDKGFKAPFNCDGGKMPGFSGNRGAKNCGMNGDTPDGYCGWSLRMHFTLNCDPNNPTFGKISHGVYAYVPEKPGAYGDTYSSAQGGAHGNFSLDEWHCFEQRVKINTPGVHDGIVQTWVDGKLGVDKRDLILRYKLDSLHPSYVGNDKNGIVSLWGTLHYGGKEPMGGREHLSGYNGNVWTDQVVVSRSRIGCAKLN